MHEKFEQQIFQVKKKKLQWIW